jgi:hypothetical protein
VSSLTKDRLSPQQFTEKADWWFRQYNWKEDTIANDFPRIRELERRIGGRSELGLEDFLCVLAWGGTERGIKEKLQALDADLIHRQTRSALKTAKTDVVSPWNALRPLERIKGVGLTYGSKVLRFFDPETFGALDTRIERNVHGFKSWAPVPKYREFLELCLLMQGLLKDSRTPSPIHSKSVWQIAEIEMAIFAFVSAGGCLDMH